MATPLQIVEMAAAEGVTLGHRQGRITARGVSPVLGQLIVENEKELVEYLGGQFVSPWEQVKNERMIK